MPSKILGTKQRIIDAIGAPLITKEKSISPGEPDTVALIQLKRPNIKPTTAPYLYPITTDATITGICNMVIETGGIIIKPTGVKASTASIARNIVKSIVALSVLFLLSIISPL